MAELVAAPERLSRALPQPRPTTLRFRDEHRQALTWLNEHSDHEAHFFGVELEVVRIGNSAPAPLFKVVALPSD